MHNALLMHVLDPSNKFGYLTALIGFSHSCLNSKNGQSQTNTRKIFSLTEKKYTSRTLWKEEISSGFIPAGHAI